MKIKVIDEAEEFIILNCCDYEYYYEWLPEPPDDSEQEK